MNVSIDYEYDPLNRLVKATYTDPNNPAAGERTYEYTYDAVGNRLSQTITIDGLAATTNYLYDAANRLLEAGGHTYTYDNNGNLLSDGVNTYAYDTANRLVSVFGPSSSVTYKYRCNGVSRDAWGITGCKSDRVSQTVNGVTTYYTLDQAAGLTQVLEDGANAYLYGAGRIAQVNTTGTEYFLGDALGSVRQMTDAAGAVTLAKVYDPYGVAIQSVGSSTTSYGFTGEMSDSTGLLYLRARYYAADTGRFISRDIWGGDANMPISYNRWAYGYQNPLRYSDSEGNSPQTAGHNYDGYMCPSSYRWGGWAGWGDDLFSIENCRKLVGIADRASRFGDKSGLPEMETWYYQLSERLNKDGYSQASKNLKHYLDGTGSSNPSDTPFQLDQAFVDNNVMKYSQVTDKINQLVNWFTNVNSGCGVSTVNPSIYSVPIRMDFEYLATRWGYIPNYELAGATASFRLDAVISGQNTSWAVPIGLDWIVKVHVVTLDYYDFHPKIQPPSYGINGPIIPDEWGKLLATANLAKEYFFRGDSYQTYNTWAWNAKSNDPVPGEWTKVGCIGEGYPDLRGTCWPE
jgi:RHS repeat-associated protein